MSVQASSNQAFRRAFPNFHAGLGVFPEELEVTRLCFGGDSKDMQEAGMRQCPAGEAAEGGPRAPREREAGPVPSSFFFSPEMGPKQDTAGHSPWREQLPKGGQEMERAGVQVCGHREGDPSQGWGDQVGRSGNLERRAPHS